LTKKTPKYQRYQDYVISDGKLIAEFEEMYQDYEDPWNQTKKGIYATDEVITANLIRKLNVKRVIELGCGLGHFTNLISSTGVEVLGVDISKTAIEKAKKNFSKCNFKVGDILDYEIYQEFKPDLIIMAQITWYVLDKLDDFLLFLRNEVPNIYLIHLLVTYPLGVQKYGAERFSSLDEIMRYFDMNYLEWGEMNWYDDDSAHTYFLGQWKEIRKVGA